MNYDAIIARLENVKPHPNADRLAIAEVVSETVIVNKDQAEGEIGVFIPAGSVLSEEFVMNNRLYRKHPETGESMGGYLESNRRVRFVKLRGVVSRGLWLPLSCLDYLELNELPTLGQTFQELNGRPICEKYIAEAPVHSVRPGRKPKTKSLLYENFYVIGDTPRLVLNFHRFKVGDVLYITEKMHGTSNRTGFVPRKMAKPNLIDRIAQYFGYTKERKYFHVSGTRNTVLSENPYHLSDDYRMLAHNRLLPHLQRGQVVYYEIVGPRIMPNHDASTFPEIAAKYGNTIQYSYGLTGKQTEIYIYKIIEHNVDGNYYTYSWEQLMDWCNFHGLNHVPLLDTVVYDGNKAKLLEQIREYDNSPSVIDSRHPKEGVVIHSRHGAYKHKLDQFCLLEDIRPYEEPEEFEYELA